MSVVTEIVWCAQKTFCWQGEFYLSCSMTYSRTLLARAILWWLLLICANLCPLFPSYFLFLLRKLRLYVCMSNLFEYPYQGGVKPVGVCVVFSALDLLLFNSIVFVCLYIFLWLEFWEWTPLGVSDFYAWVNVIHSNNQSTQSRSWCSPCCLIWFE